MSFKLFLINHSHIDIGFTDRQEVIASYQADFIRQAVDLALSDKQKARGEKEKFKFTAEGFWAVEQYLKKYGTEGRLRLEEAVKTGYFEITAGYLHFAELLDNSNIKKACSYSRDFLEKNSLPPVECAMSSDVNGMSRGFADTYAANGIKYLMTSINPHHGGPAFDKPSVPFYWRADGGRKLLCWNGLPYHGANTLGLIPGLTSLESPSVPGTLRELPELIDIKTVNDAAKRRVPAFIRALKKNGYPYDFAPVRGSALYTDNSPVSDKYCDLIEEWNIKYGKKVEIVTSTLSEFFAYLEENAGDIKTFSGEWTDWWTDGVLSTPAELNSFRRAQRILRDIRRKDPGNQITSVAEEDKLEKLLILYAEHTWGYSAAFSAPFSLPVKELDGRKSALALSAETYACELMSRYNRSSEKTVKGRIISDNNKIDTGFFHIEFDGRGVKDISTAEGSILSDEHLKIGQPVYQIFPDGNRQLEGGFGYTPRFSLKDKKYFGRLCKTEIENTGSKCVLRLSYEIEGTLSWNTEFTFTYGSKNFSMAVDFIKTVELSPEGIYAVLPLHLEAGEWYLDKPGSFAPADFQLPQTCADYYSCIKGFALMNSEKAITVNCMGSPLVMFAGLNLWKYKKKYENEGDTAYLWLTNNKWETNFRCQTSGHIRDEYVIEVCGRNEAQAILDKNDRII